VPRRRRFRPGVVEQDRAELGEQGVHGFRSRAARAAEHDGSGAGYPGPESIDDAFEAGAGHAHPEHRVVDAELNGVRRAPDERISGVESKSHAPILPDSL
jgi:hypothetical protein